VRGAHAPALLSLGLAAEACGPLERYLDLLATWNARVNLTGARTARDRVKLLVGSVAPAAPLLEAGSLLDVGSGNGSPGLVLALLRPDLEVTLLEPRRRRWAFLREAARSAGRPDIEVLCLSHDRYAGAPARNVTLRALALPLAELAGLVEEGGRLLVFGGRPRAEDPFVLEAERALAGSRLHLFRRSRFT
jgi:16S rRNA (guanine527-N7)-methyltransferase